MAARLSLLKIAGKKFARLSFIAHPREGMASDAKPGVTVSRSRCPQVDTTVSKWKLNQRKIDQAVLELHS
jgi:hypothetical protein